MAVVIFYFVTSLVFFETYMEEVRFKLFIEAILYIIIGEVIWNYSIQNRVYLLLAHQMRFERAIGITLWAPPAQFYFRPC